jgi:hypothetical protein
MSVIDVSADTVYRHLAEQVVRTSLDGAHIQVTGVAFGDRDPEALSAWLCFVVDPCADDHVAATTGSSAADHLGLIDPNGILREAESRIAITVFEVEVADEASLFVRGDGGSRVLISPWTENLAVATVTFNYWPADQR